MVQRYTNTLSHHHRTTSDSICNHMYQYSASATAYTENQAATEILQLQSALKMRYFDFI
jgi:hypothetical protein